jgi:hypothetical protein
LEIFKAHFAFEIFVLGVDVDVFADEGFVSELLLAKVTFKQLFIS